MRGFRFTIDLRNYIGLITLIISSIAVTFFFHPYVESVLKKKKTNLEQNSTPYHRQTDSSHSLVRFNFRICEVACICVGAFSNFLFFPVDLL